jgi:hypothetical protein
MNFSQDGHKETLPEFPAALRKSNPRQQQQLFSEFSDSSSLL